MKGVLRAGAAVVGSADVLVVWLADALVALKAHLLVAELVEKKADYVVAMSVDALVVSLGMTWVGLMENVLAD